MIYINSFIHFVHLKPVISCKREGCNQEEPALENFDILAAVAAKFNLKFKQQCPLLVAEEAKYDLSVLIFSLNFFLNLNLNLNLNFFIYFF